MKCLESLPYIRIATVATANLRRIFILDLFPNSELVRTGQNQPNLRIWLAEIVILTYFRLAKCLKSLPFIRMTTVATTNVRRIFIVDLFPAGELVENGQNQSNLRTWLAEIDFDQFPVSERHVNTSIQ